MSRVIPLSRVRALLILFLAAPLGFSCLTEKSTQPDPEVLAQDWWTVDDCEETPLYSFTGKKWENLQPVFRFAASFPEAWRGEVEGAAATWNGVGSRLQILVDRTPVLNSVALDGMSVWSNGPIPEQPAALGVTFSWFQGETQTEVDVVISNEQPITIGGSPGSYDLRSVVTHEFGHFCGLGDVPTMKHTMSATQHMDSRIYWTLCPGDAMGLRQLYP